MKTEIREAVEIKTVSDSDYDVEKLKGLLVPFTPNFMEYPVASLVNDPKNDFEEMTERIPGVV